MTLRRPSGVVVYAAAFAAVLGAGVALAAASFGLLRSTRLLWVSVALSSVAVLLAVASLWISGRRA